jgi:hypothetical protein
MRLIPLPLCLVFSGIAGAAFGIGVWITSTTKAEEKIEWTRTCALTPDGATAIKATCGDYVERIVEVSGIVTAAMQSQPLSIECRGYLSRGVTKSIVLDCSK